MKETTKMTPAQTREAEEAQARNRQATGGYDQTKGPDGRGQHRAKTEDVPDQEIRDAINEAVDQFRDRVDKSQVVAVMRTATELLNRSESWVRPRDTLDYDPDDLDDPRANPMGLRPAPATATRADEETAPEPDSRGHITDRKAAEAGLNDDSLADDENVPPPDRDAVAAKRGAEKSAEQFGTAGGTPLSRAEHKDDRKPTKK